MRGRYASVQVGAALLVLVAVIGLASSWMLVSRLNAESANLETVRRQRNAEVLNRAKQALIGYVAAQAAKTFEDDPGRLPCPEAAAFFGDAEYEGQSSPYCTAGGIPAVGRFPWRTVGTEKLVDASGEPLWYVVASGWAKPSSTAHTVINSNCTADPTLACYGGQLTVDGAPRAAVALIIAPGPAIAVAADSAAGCAAHNQARSTAGPLRPARLSRMRELARAGRRSLRDAWAESLLQRPGDRDHCRGAAAGDRGGGRRSLRARRRTGAAALDFHDARGEQTEGAYLAHGAQYPRHLGRRHDRPAC
ncbi:MAG: hypothetical protein RML56_01285 [Burkholderiales bacterium]|nr:hypothetical protein [Burkholderiales bacterium]